MPPHPTSCRSILILSSHLSLGFPSGLFPSGFPTRTLNTLFLSPIRATCPVHLIFLDFITQKILGKTRYPLYMRLGEPHGRSGRVRTISPPPHLASISGPFNRLRVIIPTALSRPTLEKGSLQFMFHCFLIYIYGYSK